MGEGVFENVVWKVAKYIPETPSNNLFSKFLTVNVPDLSEMKLTTLLSHSLHSRDPLSLFYFPTLCTLFPLITLLPHSQHPNENWKYLSRIVGVIFLSKIFIDCSSGIYLCPFKLTSCLRCTLPLKSCKKVGLKGANQGPSIEQRHMLPMY